MAAARERADLTLFARTAGTAAAIGAAVLVGALGRTGLDAFAGLTHTITAVHEFPSAGPATADIRLGAGLAIVAGVAVVDVDAADCRVTGVVGARVGVIALEGLATGAGPSGADVAVGAGVSIVAAVVVVDVDAAGRRITAIGRALVAVVGARHVRAGARTVRAAVAVGAGVPIVAGVVVVDVDALAGRRVAAVGSALVAIVTVRGL